MAKIDVTRISGYETMTPEQKLAALEAFEYEDNAAELERLKNANSKANSEAAEWKRKHNALLNEDEQKKQEDAEKLASALKELEELRVEKKVSEYKAKYLAMGYDEKLASETAKALADGDMDKVFANVAKHQTELEKKIKADVLKGTPRPDGAGAGTETLTKEQFNAMGYSARAKLFMENKELYNQMMNGGTE